MNPENMSRQQVRAEFNTWDRDRDYRLYLRRRVDEVGVEDVLDSLYKGARHRDLIHDDPGGAEQMLFTLRVLAHHGPRGLVS